MADISPQQPPNTSPWPFGAPTSPARQVAPLSQWPAAQVQQRHTSPTPVSNVARLPAQARYLGGQVGGNGGAPFPRQAWGAENAQITRHSSPNPVSARAGQHHTQVSGNARSPSPAQAWIAGNTQGATTASTTPVTVHAGQPHMQVGWNSRAPSSAQNWSAHHTQGTTSANATSTAARSGQAQVQSGRDAATPSPAHAWSAQNTLGTTSANTTPVTARSGQPQTQPGPSATNPSLNEGWCGRNTPTANPIMTPVTARADTRPTQSGSNAEFLFPAPARSASHIRTRGSAHSRTNATAARAGRSQAPPQPPNGPRMPHAIPPAAVARLLPQTARAPAQLTSQHQHGRLSLPEGLKGTTDSTNDAIKNFLADAIDCQKGTGASAPCPSLSTEALRDYNGFLTYPEIVASARSRARADDLIAQAFRPYSMDPSLAPPLDPREPDLTSPADRYATMSQGTPTSAYKYPKRNPQRGARSK